MTKELCAWCQMSRPACVTDDNHRMGAGGKLNIQSAFFWDRKCPYRTGSVHDKNGNKTTIIQISSSGSEVEMHRAAKAPKGWQAFKLRSSLWLVKLHFLVIVPQTKAMLQGPKGSAMYADVQNKRRRVYT
jgi:hypothetical protein